MRDTFNEINITPLTDIFLVLLIIMMVIAPLLDQQGLNLTVPENVLEKQHNKEAKIMTFAISADDKYYMDDVAVEPAKLEDTIKFHLKAFPDGLMINADANSTHGAVVRLMDSARNAGVTSISVDRI